MGDLVARRRRRQAGHGERVDGNVDYPVLVLDHEMMVVVDRGVEIGLAAVDRELAIDGSKTYFDTAVHDHHHFVIEDENRVIDISVDALAVASLPAPPPGYEIAHVDVVVRLRKREA